MVQRSKLTDSEMVNLLQQGETKDPTFALQKGIIHDIRESTHGTSSAALTSLWSQRLAPVVWDIAFVSVA